MDTLRRIPGSFRANRYRHILRRRTFLIQSRNSQRVQQLSNGRCTLRHLLQFNGRRLVLGSCATLSLLLGWIISRNSELYRNCIALQMEAMLPVNNVLTVMLGEVRESYAMIHDLEFDRESVSARRNDLRGVASETDLRYRCAELGNTMWLVIEG